MAVERSPRPAGGGRLLRAASALLGTIAAVLVFAMMAVTAVDVIGRYGFNRPLPGAFELTEVMLALTIFVALPLVCLDRGHITVSLVTDRLNPAMRRLQGAVVSLLGAGVLALVAWRLHAHGAQLGAYGDHTLFLRLPKAPIAYAMAGLTLLAAAVMAGQAWGFLAGRAGIGPGAEGAATRDGIPGP